MTIDPQTPHGRTTVTAPEPSSNLEPRTSSPSSPTVCLTFDFDAISLWIGPFAATSPSMISRGEFGAIGVERILQLLQDKAINATFFVPGHTAETYPNQTRAIATAGHEIGHHGYLHENPCPLSREEENRVLLRGLEALDKIAGVRPIGYRSPSWDNSSHTVELLIEHGFTYESSLMGNDFTPYWCRTGDRIQPDGPYLFGPTVDLVEVPVSWLLDDFPHFEYLRMENRVYPGLSAPSKVEEIWRAEFDYMVREIPSGVFTLTMHPQVIGRGHRLLMLERLIDYFASCGARFTTLETAAEEFRTRQRS
jgi:peptidoglycan-N-acetylglucosamine deacetylase